MRGSKTLSARDGKARYAKYKPTGIPWLPEVPEAWEVRKLGDVSISLHTGLNPRKFFELNSEGATNYYVTIREMCGGKIVFTKSTARINDEALRLCNNRSCLTAGDILFSGTGTIGETALLNETPTNWNIKEGIYAIKPKQNMILPRMLWYAVSSHGFLSIARAKAVGTGVKSVPMKELLSIQFICPPLPTQRAIVAFLDEKCGKVDRLVAAKEKEVALLKELRERVIADAVTKGVGDFNAETQRRRERRGKTKPSGIPWLPEVPEGWEVRRARYLFKKEQRPVRPNDEIVTAFRDGQVTLRKNRRTTGFTEATDYSHYQGVRKGDLVIHQMDAFAGCAGVSDSDGMGTPVLSVCTPFSSDVDVSYYAHVVRLMGRNGDIQSLARGIRERSADFRFETFARQCLPFPPLPEQREIVAYIEAKTAKIGVAVAGLEREIAALKEFKQRLVADVVTGQRRVA